MFSVIYRWTLKPGTEERFREAWRTLTEAIRARSGTSGSRLHRTDDGDFVAYAVWPSRELWESARALPPANAEALTIMRDCIATSQTPIPLTILDDLIE
jgi:heme-degrading monooxygenase HmoA